MPMINPDYREPEHKNVKQEENRLPPYILTDEELKNANATVEIGRAEGSRPMTSLKMKTLEEMLHAVDSFLNTETQSNALDSSRKIQMQLQDPGIKGLQDRLKMIVEGGKTYLKTSYKAFSIEKSESEFDALFKKTIWDGSNEVVRSMRDCLKDSKLKDDPAIIPFLNDPIIQSLKQSELKQDEMEELGLNDLEEEGELQLALNKKAEKKGEEEEEPDWGDEDEASGPKI